MNNRYIGVFDSGLGGLTVVKQLKKVLPDENIIYFGDTGRVPYGTRSNETIIKYVKSDVSFLKSFDIKAIIVACGTASTVALPQMKQDSDIPLIGVVEPTVEAAVKKSKSKRIAVLGTPGTIKSGMYEKLIRQIEPDAFVINKACTLFVPIVENGCTDDEIAYHVCKKYLDEILKENVDTIILGCTHYPLLTEVIGDIMGEQVTLVDAGCESAYAVKRLLRKNDAAAPYEAEGCASFYASDRAADFERLASNFLQEDIAHSAQQINIEAY